MVMQAGRGDVEATRIGGLIAEAARSLPRPDAGCDGPGAPLVRLQALAATLSAQAPRTASDARDGWLEVAALLVLAADRYEGVGDHGDRWEEVHRCALVLAARTGRPGAVPETPDRTLAAVCQTALGFAGRWLDELAGWSRAPSAALAVDDLVIAAARALLTAEPAGALAERTLAPVD